MSNDAGPKLLSWTQWLVRLFLASCVLVALDVGIALAIGPFGTSDVRGFLLALPLGVTKYLVLGAPLAAIGALADRRIERVLDHVDGSRLFATATLGALGTAAVAVINGIVRRADLEFPERIVIVHVVLIGCLVTLTVALVAPLARFIRRLGVLTPKLVHASVAVPALATLAAIALFATATFGLTPVNLGRPAALCGFAAMAALLVAARAVARSPRPIVARSGALFVLAVAVAGAASCRNNHALFTVDARLPLTSTVSGVLRDVADVDHDGAAPSWLGGADCAEGNPRIGPAQREIHGDGIDQDCRGGDAPAVTPHPAPTYPPLACRAPDATSLLLVTVDAMRADGVAPNVMPILSRVAASGMTFSRAYTNVPSTVGSLASIFSGRALSDSADNPVRTHYVDLGRPLAQRLKDAGYRTGALNFFELPAAYETGFDPVPWSRWQEARPGQGVKEGFGSSEITNAAIELLGDARGHPSFAWVHYPDAHAPYLSPAVLSFKRDELSPYERELTYIDYHLGRLLAAMDRLGILDRTIVIVTADHGEDLGNGGRQGHGAQVYESGIHVPLVIRIPGCERARIDWPVSLSQIPATVGGLLGIPIEGRPLYAPRPADALPVVSSAYLDPRVFMRAVVDTRYKLIVDVRGGGRALFDLLEDPDEERDIYRANPDAARKMESLYQRWLDR